MIKLVSDIYYMNMLERDNKKMSKDDIEKSPGTIAAKIIYNTLYDNDFELFYIGGVMGNVLYTVQLSNKEQALVAFTTAELLQAYINRKQIKQKIKKSFGKKLACVKITIDVVDKLIKQTASKAAAGLISSVKDDRGMDTVIINPNMKDKFIPISISYTTSLLGDTQQPFDQLEFDETLKISMEDVSILEYDKEDDMYLFIKEEGGDMIG